VAYTPPRTQGTGRRPQHATRHGASRPSPPSPPPTSHTAMPPRS